MLLNLFGNKYIVNKSGILPYIPDFIDEEPLQPTDKLKGRISLIVGASSGMGYSMVKTFLREGAIVIGAARHLGDLESITTQDFEFIKWDIADTYMSQMNLDYLYEKYHYIDDIIICAGVNVCPQNNGTNPVERKWIETCYVHSVNVIGVSEICKLVKKKITTLHEHRVPKVINVISSGAYMASAAPYFTSKHAIMSFTKAFMKESKGVLRVYGICPGEVKTKMINHGLFTLFSRYSIDSRKGHPDEVAELALLLCSPAGDLLDGNICVLDGGERILEQF